MISFAQYFVRSIHILACGCGSFIFYFVNKTQLIILWLMSIYLGFFQVRAFTNNAASKIFVSVCAHVHMFVRHILRSEIAGSLSKCDPALTRYCRTASLVCASLDSHRAL